jgi:hypothetical protein
VIQVYCNFTKKTEIQPLKRKYNLAKLGDGWG